MNIGVLGIIVVSVLFLILLVLNPKLSCFGRVVRSPLYPLFRKKKTKKKKKEEDYGFHLVEKKESPSQKSQQTSTKDSEDRST